MACDFNSDMGAVDRRLLDGLLPVLAKQKEKPRFIYTGGGWLFGATDDELVMEMLWGGRRRGYCIRRR